MNELQQETSPYLLQHANNPIHWKAWNDISLAQAKKENKLIVISIGYSACHWCHVMEHESFENKEVAQVMNSNFINIKIDREERPDIDAVYMKAVQIMTGQGGWPMNVVALPDGRPIWGGTYFKKNDWINSLLKLQQLFLKSPETIFDYAQQLNDGLQSLSIIPKVEASNNLDFTSIEKLVQQWSKSFDWEYGGMARAPKFMMPTNYEFLLRYGYQSKNNILVEFVYLTLTKMAYGGLFDTVGGGFSRYSVDLKWHLPHFEKMLYDNGQLMSLYASAYKLSHNPLFKEVIEKTLTFVGNEWTTQEGSFYAALDADSIDSNGHLEEGAYYVWNKAELEELLNEDFELFGKVFNINAFGYWEKGNYVLIQNQSINAIALELKLDEDFIVQKKKKWEQILQQERAKRNKPRLDDKCLTSWNAIMLKGFADAYKALGEKKYLDIALKNAEFIINNLWSSEGNLYRTYKNGTAKINGYLEDYANVIAAFITLYEVTLDENWLQSAKQLTDYCFDYFYDQNIAFFSFTSKNDSKLVAPHFEVEDNVIPAANSVMANNLFYLSIYFNNSYYEKIALQMTESVIAIVDYPSAYSNWLNVMLNFSAENKELAVCGLNAEEYMKKINGNYWPNVIKAGSASDSKLPFLANRYVEDQTLFYLCQDKSCELPKTNYKEIAKELNLNQ